MFQRFVRHALVISLGLAALVLVTVGADTPVAADAVGVYNGVTYSYPSYSYPSPYYNYGYGYASPYSYGYNNVYTPVYGYNYNNYGYNNFGYAYAPYGYRYSYGYGIPPQRFTNKGCAVGNYSCLRSK